ncbi:thiamine pyrophosphokinase [Rhinocladiella similis]
MSTDWYPCGLLNDKPMSPYAVLILNQPINKISLNAVIESASLLVCADGGANGLLEYNHNAANGFEKRLPDAIIGDLDSIAQHAEQYYRARGVHVVKDPDQYSTDFTKCLKWIRNWATEHEGSSNSRMDVVVFGGLGGRVDQGFSQIHHLYLAENDKELLNGRIYLLSEQSLSFVLADNINLVHLEAGYFEENVGIIPVLGRTLITTKGLEWDVDQWPTEFGGQMSTSNHIRSNTIELSFEGPRPLFTLELHHRFTAAGS